MLRRLVERFAVVVVPAAVLWLLLTGSLFSPSPAVIGGQLAAIALLLWSRVAFAGAEFRADAEPGSGPLLTRGPYARIRHPIYAAALLFVWASILGHWSAANAVVGAIFTAVVALRIPLEEARLRSRFPDYAAYATRTRRVVPFVL